MMASITMSQAARSWMSVVPFSRDCAAAFCSVVMPPFSTPRSTSRARDFSIPAKPLSRNFWSCSSTTTSKPAVAATCAMPEPINPQPSTPTFLISIIASLRLQILHDHGNALPAADAGGREPIARLSPSQFIEQRDQQARTAGAQRMPQRNGAAVHVGLRRIEAEFFHHGQALRCEGLIQLDQINV